MKLAVSSGITRPIALAAPVELGTMLQRLLLNGEVALSLRSVKDHLIACVSVDGCHDTRLEQEQDH
jgi:hypothetical protein